MARWITFAALSIVVGLLDAPNSRAHSPTQLPAFDVASIKANKPSGKTLVSAPAFKAAIKPSSPNARGTSIRYLPGTMDAQNVPLHFLVQGAYGVRDFQVTGGPAWMNTERYDITAEVPDGAPQGQMLLMLRALLADRFKLTFHRETRKVPLFFLTVAKGGMKLPEAKEGSCVTADPDGPPLTLGQPPRICGTMRIGPKGFDGSKLGMQQITTFFSDVLGRVVIDKTDIKGTFDAHLEFARDKAIAAGILGNAAPGGPGGPPRPADSSAPSIFTAVQEQLGLKLESGKGPVEVIVVDHAEKPSEN